MSNSARDQQCADGALPVLTAKPQFQLEIGGRWQLCPSANMTLREWLWSPYANAAWPGRRVRYANVPREMWKPHLIDNYAKGEADARFWWGSVAIRVVGLDVGLAAFFWDGAATRPTGQLRDAKQ